MIKFHELRITPDSKYLVIDAAIPNYDYYQNKSIVEVIIDDKNSFKLSGPSDNPIKRWVPEIAEYTKILSYGEESEVYTDNEEGQYCWMHADTVKRIKLVYKLADLTGADNIYFVYVRTEGDVSKTEAGNNYEIIATENDLTLGTAIDLQFLYRQALKYIKAFNNGCNFPTKFIDYILHFKAFELYIQTGHYIQAIEYFNKYFSKLFKAM